MCLVCANQHLNCETFLLWSKAKSFLNLDVDLHTQGTLYRILKWTKFLLNYVIFGLLIHKSRYIDENDREFIKKLFLVLQVAKHYSQLKFLVVLTNKKMFDFQTSNNPTTHFFRWNVNKHLSIFFFCFLFISYKKKFFFKQNWR